MGTYSTSLITILRSSYIHEIQIAKTLLSSYEITSYIFDEHLNLIIGTAFTEGYKLKVSELDFQRAQKILKESGEGQNS